MSEKRVMWHDGLPLSAQVDGPEGAPVVLLVHGFPDTPWSWQGVVPLLVAAGYQVVRPWLRGYTPETAQADARYDMLAVAGDLIEWREQLAAVEVHLVGHDWGAVAAMVAASRQPDHWQSVSLLAIPPFQRMERAFEQLPLQARHSSYMLLLQSSLSPWLVRRNDCAYLRHLWSVWSPTWAYTEADFEPVRTAFGDPHVAWAATRYYRALFTPWRQATREVFRLARAPIRVPALFLTGADDGCMVSGLFDRVVEPRCFPAGVRVERLTGCGHFLQAEAPARVADVLLGHIQTA